MKFNKLTFFTGLMFAFFTLTATGQTETNSFFSDIQNTKDYDVITLAKKDSTLSTFVKLAELSQLNKSMDLAGSYTVFIPTNKAFKALSKEKYSELTDPKNTMMLINVLKKHILPNKVYAIDFEDSQIIDTNSDENIVVSKSGIGSDIIIGGATVLKADVDASNGVIHVVDQVIEATSDVLTD